MVDILLDTNIVIYLLAQNQKYLSFLKSLRSKRIGISVVSYMELLVGARSDRDMTDIRSILRHFTIIPLDPSIAEECAGALRRRKRRSLRNPRLADIVIAQTALRLGIPLATNNPKDFSSFKALKILVP
jgi:predicted nucleic acid-binding protein